jgi:glycosyltransferase involved in cell wall biosynthesis
MTAVSACMPVLNGGDLVVRAVESLLAQDHPELEIVIVDDGSTDGTPSLLERRFGNRITLVRNERRSGQGRALNRAIAIASAPLIKFLDHDDFLEPSCVSRLAAALDEHPPAGLAFCRRRLEVVDLGEAPPWLEALSAVHTGFSELHAVNDGDVLLGQLVRDELRSNWIGEPAVAMVRRSAIEAVGGFSVRIKHYTDFDLWVRILTGFDAVFVDDELATYRRSPDSLSNRNAASGNAWMDRLWILEGLCAIPGVPGRYPQIARLRDDERRIATRTAARRVVRRDTAAPLARWVEYLRYRARPGRSALIERPV